MILCDMILYYQVESNHQLWIREKDALTHNLTRINAENTLLRTEVARLQDLLECRDRKLFELTGIQNKIEEF